MTDIATTYRELEDPVTSVTNATETRAPITEQQVLVTEQQVLFATAAAQPLQPAKTRWTELVRAIAASVRAAFVTSSDEARPKRRHYPPRTDYLEDSRMAREMFRL